MRLACRKYTRKLCLFVDGLLNEKECADIMEHVKTCSRCANYLESLRKSKSCTDSLKTDMPQYTQQQIQAFINNAFNSQDEKCLERECTSRRKKVFAVTAFPMASAAVVFIIAVMMINFSKKSSVPNKYTDAQETKTESVLTVQDLSKRSFYWLNNGCAVKSRNAQLEQVNVSNRSVYLKLIEGTVLIAAIPGEYDTIMVSCDQYRLLTSGTKFIIRKDPDLFHVAVIEGSVNIGTDNPDELIGLEAGQYALIKNRSNPVVKSMSKITEDSIGTLFLDFPDNASGVHCDLNDKSIKENGLLPENYFDNRNQNDSLYNMAVKFYRKGMLHAALDILDRYGRSRNDNMFEAYLLTADCYNRLKQFENAFLYYQKAIDLKKRDKKAETAMHISSRILLYELKRVNEAIKQINRYFSEFPDGYYRQMQHHYLIEAYFELGEKEKTFDLMTDYLEKHPHGYQASRYEKMLCKYGSSKRR